MQVTDEYFPAVVPPPWSVCFAVADCDATTAKAKELGATVTMEPMDMPIGRFAGLIDPQGASSRNADGTTRLRSRAVLPKRSERTPRRSMTRGQARGGDGSSSSATMSAIPSRAASARSTFSPEEIATLDSALARDAVCASWPPRSPGW